jgi:hypothetical protein
VEDRKIVNVIDRIDVQRRSKSDYGGSNAGLKYIRSWFSRGGLSRSIGN